MMKLVEFRPKILYRGTYTSSIYAILWYSWTWFL